MVGSVVNLMVATMVVSLGIWKAAMRVVWKVGLTVVLLDSWTAAM